MQGVQPGCSRFLVWLLQKNVGKLKYFTDTQMLVFGAKAEHTPLWAGRRRAQD